MENVSSSFVRVAHCSSQVVTIIEMKVQVASLLHNVELKNLLELLVYLKCVMEDNSLSVVCEALLDTKTWHCLKIRAATNGKLEVLKYVNFNIANEIDLLSSQSAGCTSTLSLMEKTANEGHGVADVQVQGYTSMKSNMGANMLKVMIIIKETEQCVQKQIVISSRLNNDRKGKASQEQRKSQV